MREIKEICEVMLTPPAPPMTSPDRMLQLASRAHQRRQTRVAGGFVAIATSFAIISTILTTAPHPTRVPFGDRAALQIPASYRATSWSYTPVLVLAALQAAVPYGYTTTTPVIDFLADTGGGPPLGPIITVEVTRAGRTGVLSFMRLDHRPGTDPCRKDTTQDIYPQHVRRYRDATPQCETIQRRGVTVTVGTRAELRFATRTSSDQRLIVFASPFPIAATGRLPLPEPPLTLDQLADLISQPAFTVQ